MLTPANASPVTIETMFAINIGFLRVSLLEENHNRTKRGTNIADPTQVTISNWHMGLSVAKRACAGEFGGSMATSVQVVEWGASAMVPRSLFVKLKRELAICSFSLSTLDEVDKDCTITRCLD